MRIWAHATVISVFLLVLSGWARGAETEFTVAAPFPVASVHFEQNATDGDVEVVFEVRAEDDGLTELLIVSPDGRTVVDFNAPHSTTLGRRHRYG